jgi:lipopolysaccharide/colanic/teichoic acid biosynthesis glycosyltransferase
MQTDLLYAPASYLATRELLFVGFEHDSKASISDFPYHEQQHHFVHLNHPEQAMLWLEKRVGTPYRPPSAVFFELEWLQRHGYGLLHNISKHPHLRFVPVIALASGGATIPKKELIKNGLDDCYSLPIPWEKLEMRLKFLKQYKAQLPGFGNDLDGRIKKVQTPMYKRIFDILAASIGLLITAPIWLLVALAIKLESRGPVFYFSRRVGTSYRIFDFIKFRSMHHDAENQLDEYRHLNQYDGNSVFVKINGDPRVTRVGRFIRNYSIDELPQLINVLRGDMSLVGNRPLPQYEAEQLTTDQWCGRFLAPAGMTGKWQVTKSKRVDMTSEERIRLDVEYASGYSLSKDLGIIFSTFRALKQRENA